MKRIVPIVLLAAALFSMGVANAKDNGNGSNGGNGGNGGNGTEASCWASPSQVPVGADYYLFATGLPTSTPLNVFVTDEHGTEGLPIGMYADGNLDYLGMHAEYVGTATIQITGPTKKNMDTMKIYARCSMEVLPV
jgi:hypothetical protein